MFRLTLHNLDSLQQARNHLKSKTPGLAWQFLVHDGNDREIETAKKLARESGVVITFNTLTRDQLLKKSEKDNLCPSNKFISNGLTFDFRSEQSEAELGFPYFSPKEGRVNDWIPTLAEGVSPVCHQPFTCVVINFDGKIVPCCQCYGDQFILGDLLSQDLDSIWNGEKMRGCREFLLNYGKKQNTGSPCESHYCPPMPVKYIESETPLANASVPAFSQLGKFFFINRFLLKNYLRIFYNYNSTRQFFTNLYRTARNDRSSA